MHWRTSRASTLAISALIALVLAGCGKEAQQEAAHAPEAPAPDQTAIEQTETVTDVPAAVDRSTVRPEGAAPMPRLVDLGRGTCIPCKMMAPILEELKSEYEGRAVVEVIDLREDSQAGTDYGIRLIPTQIFFDAEGKEVWRHEGFLPKDQITAKFAEMGVRPSDD